MLLLLPAVLFTNNHSINKCHNLITFARYDSRVTMYFALGYFRKIALLTTLLYSRYWYYKRQEINRVFR